MEKTKDELYDLPDTHQILIQVTARDLKRVIMTAVNKAMNAKKHSSRDRIKPNNNDSN